MSAPAPPSSSSFSSSGFVLQGADYVEDFVWGDRFGYVSDLVRNGNWAFRRHRLDFLEKAVGFYTRANQIKPNDPVILGNRCATYIRYSSRTILHAFSLMHSRVTEMDLIWSRISQFLKLRSASDSEDKPLSGLDPTIHAELALKDAEKLVDIQCNSVRSFVLKASALLLLEKYDIARDAVISGLQVDPFSNSLQGALQQLEKIHTSCTGSRSNTKPERTNDFDCTMCLKLLYEPITTPCGHSFCRSCLFQSMDRGNKCPLCRSVLFISSRTSAVSVTLNDIIQKNFPEQYAERKAEHDSLTNLGGDLIPLFVKDIVIPCQKYPLHICEPRYKLMVGIDPLTRSFAKFACEVEVTECEPSPDGHFYIEVEGRRRFRIICSRDQDGYRVAEVEWVQDVEYPQGSRERLMELTSNVAEQVSSWLTRAKQAVRQDRAKYEKLLSLEHMMPTPRDPERFSFRLATLTNRRRDDKLIPSRISRGMISLKAEEQGWRLQ